MYLLELPRRGNSNKYPKRMISLKKYGTVSEKNTQSAHFCADRIDVISSFAVITNAVVKRVHCNIY